MGKLPDCGHTSYEEALRAEELQKQAQRKRELEDQELQRKMKEKGLDSCFSDSRIG